MIQHKPNKPLYLYSLPETQRHKIIERVKKFRIAEISSIQNPEASKGFEEINAVYQEIYSSLEIKTDYHDLVALSETLMGLAEAHRKNSSLTLKQAYESYQNDILRDIGNLEEKVGDIAHALESCYLVEWTHLTKLFQHMESVELFNLGQSITNIIHGANQEIDEKKLLPRSIRLLEQSLYDQGYEGWQRS